MNEAKMFVRRAAATSLFWISTALLMMVVFFAVVAPTGTFLSWFNAQTIAIDSSTLLILATGLTLVVVSGGLDLSVGSVMAFSAVIGITVMQDVSSGGWLAVAIGGMAALLAGIGWGAINGFLVAYARIPSFVVTLGTLGAALGAARLITGGSNPSGTPDVLQSSIGFSTIAGIPTLFVIGISVAIVFSLLMKFTVFGEWIYLVGSNEEGARRGGIPVRWVQFRVYVLSGGLAGLAGLLDLARFDSANVSTGHITELLAALAAVIIGGASLFGGTGLIIGSVVGVFIPVVLNDGFIVIGLQPFWHEIVVGVVLIAAVGLDQVRRSAALQRPIPGPESATSSSDSEDDSEAAKLQHSSSKLKPKGSK